MKLSDYVFSRLKEWGARHVFLVSGAAALHNIGFIFMEHGYGELSLAQPVLLKLDNFSEFMPYLAAENLP